MAGCVATHGKSYDLWSPLIGLHLTEPACIERQHLPRGLEIAAGGGGGRLPPAVARHWPAPACMGRQPPPRGLEMAAGAGGHRLRLAVEPEARFGLVQHQL